MARESVPGGGFFAGVRGALTVLLSVALAASLGGCRESDVLTEKIIGDVGEYELDETLTPVAVESPEASSDISSEEDESDREDDHDYDEPTYDEDDATDDEEAQQAEETENSEGDADATSGDSEGDAETSSTVSDGSGDEESDSPRITFDFTGSSALFDEEEDTEDSDDVEDEDTETGTSWVSSSDTNTGTADTSQVTVATPDTGYGNLPEVATVAAAGSIAALVQSIGGEGALSVCNTEWYEGLPSSAYGNLSELSDVVCIDGWGDGSSMADCYEQIAEALPHDGTAAVVVDENTHESAYDDYFAEMNISVVVLEAYGTVDVSDDFIADDVAVIGELLAGMADGGEYAKEQAAAWKKLYTDALETTLSNNGGYSIYESSSTTMDFLYKNQNLGGNANTEHITYISKNRYWFFYVYSLAEMTVDTITTTGYISISYSHSSDHTRWPIGYWTSKQSELLIDVTDGLALYIPMSAQGKWNSRSRYATMDYYLQHAGAVFSGLFPGSFYSTSTELVSGTVPYSITSLYPYGKTSYSSGFALRPYSDYITAGDDEYPYVIVHTAEIADAIVSSAGTADADSLTVGLYNTGKDYTVVVMPSGISGSWAYGTFESFLMAPYFYCLYQQVDGGTVDLSYSDGYVNDFYEQFYRCGADVLSNTDQSESCGWYGYWVTAECAVE